MYVEQASKTKNFKIFENWAGDITHLVKVHAKQLGKCDDVVSAHITKHDVMDHLESSVLGRWVQSGIIRGLPCLDSLVYLVSSRPARDPISQVNEDHDGWHLKNHAGG